VSRYLVIIPVSCDSVSGDSCLTDLGGTAVLRRSLVAAREARPERIVVSTSERQHADAVRRWGYPVVERPAELADPDLSAEDAVLHCLASLESESRTVNVRPGTDETIPDAGPGAADLPEYVVLLSPDLPLRRPGRVADACALVERDQAASLFSCTRETPLYWRHTHMGLIPYYDPENRPGRSARNTLGNGQVWHRENGSLYVFRRSGLQRHHNRLFGKVAFLEMDPEEAISTETPAGLTMCRAIVDTADSPAQFSTFP